MPWSELGARYRSGRDEAIERDTSIRWRRDSRPDQWHDGARGRIAGPDAHARRDHPAVSQATIGSTICLRGWTSTIRPPADYTNDLKRHQLAEYGYADRDTRHYEE